MKILITTDWYRPVINGVVTSVLNLTEQLEKRGHEVKVLKKNAVNSKYFLKIPEYFLTTSTISA